MTEVVDHNPEGRPQDGDADMPEQRENHVLNREAAFGGEHDAEAPAEVAESGDPATSPEPLGERTEAEEDATLDPPAAEDLSEEDEAAADASHPEDSQSQDPGADDGEVTEAGADGPEAAESRPRHAADEDSDFDTAVDNSAGTDHAATDGAASDGAAAKGAGTDDTDVNGDEGASWELSGLDPDLARDWHVWSMVLGRTIHPALEKLPNRLPNIVSAIVCTADGFNLAALNTNEQEVTRMAALTSSLFAIAAATSEMNSSAPGTPATQMTMEHGDRKTVVVSRRQELIGHALIHVVAEGTPLGNLLMVANALADEVSDLLDLETKE